MHAGSCGTNVSHPLLVFLPGKEHSVALFSGGEAPNESEVHPLSTYHDPVPFVFWLPQCDSTWGASDER